ncbi:hypothetical protein D7X33_17705 [Butyricicoccus sp. 1XD8-22]|nr:hypothetical protein D7X33_17705 [Butyricicoccus sp. 1XD8-22]
MTKAIDRFQQYLINGRYQKLRQLEQRQKETRQFIRKQLQDKEGKRFEFKKVGYVGRFVRKIETYTDHKALIEELTNYLSVSSMIQLDVLNFNPASDDVKTLVEPFSLPVDTYVKPTLNKAGKAYVNVYKGYYDNYPTILGYMEEVAAYAIREEKEKAAKKEYEQLMSDLKSELTKSVKTNYGTLSVIQKKPKYDLLALLNEFDEEFLLEQCQVKLTEFHELIEMGILERTFLEPFQQIVDVRVDFILQSIESEQRAFEFMEQRKKALQQLLAS